MKTKTLDKIGLTSLVIALVAFILFLLTAAPGCGESATDTAQAKQTAAMMAEANAVLGMPAIDNWTEKRLLKQLYELRDQEGLETLTYTQALDGSLRFLCNSIGYGMPFSAQYSNPERNTLGTGNPNMPQPEPNGLFMPEGLSATWILCIDPADGAARPVYAEPSIIVSPFDLLGEL